MNWFAASVLFVLVSGLATSSEPLGIWPKGGGQDFFSLRVNSEYFHYIHSEEDTVADARFRITSLMDTAVQSGTRRIDVPVSWAGVDMGDARGEPFRGSYIWEQSNPDWRENHLDFILGLAQERGIEVNLLVEATPDWVHPDLAALGSNCAAPASTNPYCSYEFRYWHPPRDADELRKFEEFLTALTSHVETDYPGLIGHYEIWNEPNNQSFWQPDLNAGESPTEYVRLLRSAYLTIKSDYPDARIAFGGISLNNFGYLQEFYEAARRDFPDSADNDYFFDVLSVHPYVFPASPVYRQQSPERYLPELEAVPFTSVDALTQQPFSYIGQTNGNFLGFRDMKRVVDEQEPGNDKELYLGEFGYRVPYDITDEQRSLYLKTAYSLARDYEYVKGLTWFTYYQSSGLDPDFLDWAVVTRDLVPSFTFRAYEQIASETGFAPDGGSPVRVTSGGADDYLELSSVQPQVVEGDVERWELYIDGELVQTSFVEPLQWPTTDMQPGIHRVTVAAFTTDGSVWPAHSKHLTTR